MTGTFHIARVGVAISTTGHEHRMEFLETAVREWDRCLPDHASLFVTVDGSTEDAERVANRVNEWTGSVYRVGHPRIEDYTSHSYGSWIEGERLGVAANKNTGLELLMDNTKVEHLFLSDDDCWPLFPESLTKHIDFGIQHSIVCWGKSRLTTTSGGFAEWSWPRGVMLYQTRAVVEAIGGMDERFGPGGHEHVEYSQRIYNIGVTPAPFPSPTSYATRGAQGAGALWHCEDMRKPGEHIPDWDSRRKAITSIKRKPGDWSRINKIMTERAGSVDFVGFRAHENGRASATLCFNKPSQGADE